MYNSQIVVSNTTKIRFDKLVFTVHVCYEYTSDILVLNLKAILESSSMYLGLHTGVYIR
jgi:hypothetical protein